MPHNVAAGQPREAGTECTSRSDGCNRQFGRRERSEQGRLEGGSPPRHPSEREAVDRNVILQNRPLLLQEHHFPRRQCVIVYL